MVVKQPPSLLLVVHTHPNSTDSQESTPRSFRSEDRFCLMLTVSTTTTAAAIHRMAYICCRVSPLQAALPLVMAPTPHLLCALHLTEQDIKNAPVASPGLLSTVVPLRYYSSESDARCRLTALPLPPPFEDPIVA